MGDQVRGAQESVNLMCGERRLAGGVIVDGVDRHVQVLAPVVELGDVRLLQGVVDGQGVKPERLAQDRLADFRRLAREVQPHHPARRAEPGRAHLGGGRPAGAGRPAAQVRMTRPRKIRLATSVPTKTIAGAGLFWSTDSCRISDRDPKPSRRMVMTTKAAATLATIGPQKAIIDRMTGRRAAKMSHEAGASRRERN